MIRTLATSSNTPASTMQTSIPPASMETQLPEIQAPRRAAQLPLPPPPAYTRYAERSSNNSAAQARPQRRLIINAPTLIRGSHHSVNCSSFQHIRSSIMLLQMLNSSLVADRDVVLNCGLTVVAGDSSAAFPNILYPQSRVQGQAQQQAQTQGQAQPNIPFSQQPQQQKHGLMENGGTRFSVPATRDTDQDVSFSSLNNESSARVDSYAQSVISSSNSMQQSALVSANMPACVSHESGVDVGESDRNELVSKATAHKKSRDTEHRKGRKTRRGMCKPSSKHSSNVLTRSNHDEVAAEKSTTLRLTRLQKRQLMKTVSVVNIFTFKPLSNHSIGSRKKT